MGIVVTIAMFLGLLAMFPVTTGINFGVLSNPLLRRVAAIAVLLAGIWNALWYGLRNLEHFWGLVALGSGVVMIAVALALLTELKSVKLRLALAFLLLGFFALYFITLIQLNLGMPILR